MFVYLDLILPFKKQHFIGSRITKENIRGDRKILGNFESFIYYLFIWRVRVIGYLPRCT